MHTSFFSGFSLAASLIVAIGAQNAHVLRMGLRRQYILLTIGVCILGETLLISLGAVGVGSFVAGNPVLVETTRWVGAAFLGWYGLRAWRAAWGSHALVVDPGRESVTWRGALLSAAAVTFLNPHAYLDAVVLLGSIGGKHGDPGRWWFAFGAICAGTAWFFLLGYGSRVLAPWFAKPVAWRVLDALIGSTMLALAIMLVLA